MLTHIYGIQKDGNDNPVYETAKEKKKQKLRANNPHFTEVSKNEMSGQDIN